MASLLTMIHSFLTKHIGIFVRFLSVLVLSVFASQAYAPGMVRVKYEDEDGNAVSVRFSYADSKEFGAALKNLRDAPSDQKVSAWQNLVMNFYKAPECRIKDIEDASVLSLRSEKPRPNVRAAQNILKVLHWDKEQVQEESLEHDQNGYLQCLSHRIKERYAGIPLPDRSFDIGEFLNTDGQLTEKGSNFLKIIEKVTFDGVGDTESVNLAIEGVKRDSSLAILAEGQNEQTLRWLLTSEHGHRARPLVSSPVFRGYSPITKMPLVEVQEDGALKLSPECLTYFAQGMRPRYGRKEDGLDDQGKSASSYPSMMLEGIISGVTGGWGVSCTREVGVALDYARRLGSAIFWINTNHPNVIAHDVGKRYNQVNCETAPGHCFIAVWHPNHLDQAVHNPGYMPPLPTPPKDFEAFFQNNMRLLQSFLNMA